MKSQLKKELEGNRWFNETTMKLQSDPSLSVTALKIIITDAIMEYLIGAISFHMFIEIIDSVGENDEKNPNSEIDDIITKLLSLSRYAANPQNNKASIIDIFCEVVNQLQRADKK